MGDDGPTSIEQLYEVVKVRDPTLSQSTDEGIMVARPRLSLFPTRIEGRKGQLRRAIAVIGQDEANGAQLAGAAVRFLEGQRDGSEPTWGQLRSAADAELIHDALDVHEIGGQPVLLDSYTDELLPVYYGVRIRDLPAHGEVAEVKLVTGAITAYRELPCPLCDNRNYGVKGRLCKRHWRMDYEANLRTYESLSPKPEDESIGPHNTPPSKSRGIPADRTGDSASARADTGEVDGLIRDEILTPSEARVVELTAAGWNLHEIGREMGTAAPTAAEHLKRARGKLNPRRRRLTWREEMARSVPVVKVKRRQPSRSLLGQDSEVSQRRPHEVVCPMCHLIVRRALIRDGACTTCSETFSDSLSTKARLVALSKWRGTDPLFLATA